MLLMDEGPQVTLERALVAARQRLESLQRYGVEQLPKARAVPGPIPAVPLPTPPKPTTPEQALPAPRETPLSAARSAAPPPAITAPPAAMSPAAAKPPPAVADPGTFGALVVAEAPPGAAFTGTPDERLAALQMLRDEVVQCTRCTALATTRTQTVFGVGSPRTRVCLMGEAPGVDEDRLGEPFVGRAGQLLDKMIEACTLKRPDVYILNVLKCRPPNNRTPQPDEVAHCRGFFERQLELIRPEFICCLGATAAQSLLQTTQSLSRLRGRLHDYRGMKVVITYHPSYLLRYPENKRAAWDDLQLLMQHMGLQPAKK